VAGRLPGDNYAIRAGYESNVLVEGNYFDGTATPHEINEDDGGPGTLNARDNEYAMTSGAQDQAGTAFPPPIPTRPIPRSISGRS
jgi:pectate lyase